MFEIDLMSRTPIYEQLVNQTKKLLLAGVLQPSDKMPSVRELSAELSVNPNTAQKAYTELCAKGILVSVPGKGCYISEEASKIAGQIADEKMEKFKLLAKELISSKVSKETLIGEIEKVYSERGKKE